MNHVITKGSDAILEYLKTKHQGQIPLMNKSITDLNASANNILK